jgi:hypothetical protein
VGGVPDFNATVRDPHQPRRCSLSGNEHGVEAGGFQFAAEIAAGVGIAPAAGER